MAHKIAIIGLGYVGLPLAVEFAKNKFNVIGFDINEIRIKELKANKDNTLEISTKVLQSTKTLNFSSSLEDLKTANIYIVTVPTPITKHKSPDLTPIIKASKTIAKVLKKGDIVIYESTVYPGCTEEVCAPILESESKLVFNKDFFCGYSPERINPGDKTHTISKIIKVTSGSTPEVATIVDNLYKSIITAGTHKTSSIKVAEAAKVIENTQRDLNIAFINELAIIFDKLDIDTTQVLAAAGTKWNFLPFTPGLVGGHCIGVDPYYLTHKAESVGYHPEVILSGRRINSNMGMFVANKLIKLLALKGSEIKGADVLVMGITFKENCPDIRNTGVINVIKELNEFGLNVDVYDSFADKEEVKQEYEINLIPEITKNYKAIVLAVKHDKFNILNWKNIISTDTVVFDLKGFLPDNLVTARL
ncbi:nucleotide sugar dehydrogenase [Lacinutrix venerupis]|uniref:Vi polysaccharide biosynthesis protein VipA/TviB n=1 Tax=Lacinutrix venerupis TaxID=1486034 RepID=A0AAC9LK01_9FLAO|nr:nucleotide sugar dehydrogenase [Lacinutrix venerupis]APX98907.1 Vi polysaccharide biosynthesis protein VipA/TviB [Lacinutrix venerupis]